MSVLVVGISHRSAPVSLLENLALDPEGARKLVADVADSEHVREAAVIATCNRVEIYADVDRFHGSVEEVSQLLVERAGSSTEMLVPHLYVHYDDGAVSHLFNVAAGLDSMVVGESQILGQTREALRVGQELGTVGPSLNLLFQQALRVGKRTHAETDIDSAAPSLVTAALDHTTVRRGGLAGRKVVILGAGSMAALSTATVTRMGAGEVVLANRSLGNAERLAEEYGVRALPLADLDAELADAEVLITCTGATGIMVSAARLEAARAGRTDPLTIIDLALPHDVDPDTALLPGVELTGLAQLAEQLDDHDAVRDIDGVRSIVSQEVTAFLSARRQASVTPTVVALRTMATGVVETEMERLVGRLPELDPEVVAEIRRTVHRVSEKLLHQPTVRVRELADRSGEMSYATALAELFALDPAAVSKVTRAELPERSDGSGR